MVIGVFDSGVGGKSVAVAIQKHYPNLDILLREDKKNLPYGTKTKKELLVLVQPILEAMVTEGCEVIVIACNTVTTNIIGELREVIEVPLVGIEPMVKPAAELTKTKTITICATPATLDSERYNWLKEEHAKGINIIEPDCRRWAKMVEDNSVDRHEIEAVVKLSKESGSDVIVLGCTHYHWIEQLVKEIAGPDISILQPEDAVVRQLARVLKQLG